MKRIFRTILSCAILLGCVGAGLGNAQAAKPVHHVRAKHKASKARKQQKRKVQARRAARRAGKNKAA